MDANELLEQYKEKVGELRGTNRAYFTEIQVLTERLSRKNKDNSSYAIVGFIIGLVSGIALTVLLTQL